MTEFQLFMYQIIGCRVSKLVCCCWRERRARWLGSAVVHPSFRAHWRAWWLKPNMFLLTQTQTTRVTSGEISSRFVNATRVSRRSTKRCRGSFMQYRVCIEMHINEVLDRLPRRPWWLLAVLVSADDICASFTVALSWSHAYSGQRNERPEEDDIDK